MLFSGPGCGNQWILYYDKPIKGYVVDAETNKLLDGAIVIGMWQLSGFLSQGFDGYAKIIVEKTDSNGAFNIPFWINLKPWKVGSAVHELAPKLVIYKPGYKIYFSHKLERAGFPKDTSKTKDEKQKLKEEYTVNPARLMRIYTDDQIFEKYNKFSSQADFPSSYYSNKESEVIFNALDEELSQLKDKNEFNASRLIISNKELRQFWVTGDK